MKARFPLWLTAFLLLPLAVSGATRYVNLNNPLPVPPYTNWETAAVTIQDAVDLAVTGDEVLVANGVYSTGGRTVSGGTTNRVAIKKPVIVRSVNGPSVTVIEGQKAPGSIDGSGAVRCAYVSSGAVLSGFTLTNGHTGTNTSDVDGQKGGGAFCPNGVLTNCVLAGNSALDGGGAYGGILANCTIIGNTANAWGGGTYQSNLKNCTLRSNTGKAGGGAHSSQLYNCSLIGNKALVGGGAKNSKLNNCTLTGNSAQFSGGGVSGGSLINCIVYYNTARVEGQNYNGSDLSFCCASPLSPGIGNIEMEPLLASTSHLSKQSPCIGRGTNNVVGVDIDGDLWLNPPCIGADQVLEGQATGALEIAITSSHTNVAVNFHVSFIASQEGWIRDSSWDFGDGTVVSNRAYVTHAWSSPGVYAVRLTGYNDSFPQGVSTMAQIHVSEREVYYVNVANTTPVHPYTNWASAATNIQAAVDAGMQPGRLVLVADGVYGSGYLVSFGAHRNRVVVREGVEVRSINGPQTTVVSGNSAASGSVRCAYVGKDSVLSGFTLTNGRTRAGGTEEEDQSGGGAWCEASGLVTNCIIKGNRADFRGGGVYSGSVYDCVFSNNVAGYGGAGHTALFVNCSATGNSATYGGAVGNGLLYNCNLSSNSANFGGGAHYGQLRDCTLAWNFATNGGGAYESVLNNCTLVGNSAHQAGGAYSGALTNCVIRSNSAIGEGGGAHSADLGACALIGNSATNGGGVHSSTLDLCTLDGNSATNGGGAYGGYLRDCALTCNTANRGGGVYKGWLLDSVLSGNLAAQGGGASDATLTRCKLIGNAATQDGGGGYLGSYKNCILRGNVATNGGGAYSGTLNNCVLNGNSATYGGGGCRGSFNNCTLTGNSATVGGGTYKGSIANSIVYFNAALEGQNYSLSALNYSCTTPPTIPDTYHNIEMDPMIVSASHLSAQSPCIGRGSTNFTTGVDIDGDQWLNPPCIGADQFMQGQANGTLEMFISASYTNVAIGFPASFVAISEGQISGSLWDFGDGNTVSNRAYVTHAWSEPGVYLVRLTGYNDSFPEGVSTTVQVRVGVREIYYSDVANVTPAYPYTSWASAATNIQDAIDAGVQGGRLVLVAEGVYRSGGRLMGSNMTNRITVVGAEVRSVNGPQVTIIEGYAAPGSTNGNGDGAIRCAHVGEKAVLSGFTLTNGHTRTQGASAMERSGGGALCEFASIVTNCILTGNSAETNGGGVFRGNLIDCLLLKNSSRSDGGGAYNSTLNNCTLSGNSAERGGGVIDSMLTNCTLMNNSAYFGGGARNSTIINSTLSTNSARYGGGVDNGKLQNCTLSGNTASYGGGAWDGTLIGCTLLGNLAYNGGGVSYGSPVSCLIVGNKATYGGGVYGGNLNNCTVVLNSASYGGGTYSSLSYPGSLLNCIVYYNSAPEGTNYFGGTNSYCCTAPLSDGIGNIENAPLFVNLEDGDFRLQSNSPCINSGTNAPIGSLVDLDGNPRIVGGRFDMGAYEFQSPGSTISYAWLQQYGLSTEAATDSADSDSDGFSNLQEWITGTDPTNAASSFRMTTLTGPTNDVNEVIVRWISAPYRTYTLERASGTNSPPVFKTICTNILGLENYTAFFDTNSGPGPVLYRVRLER